VRCEDGRIAEATARRGTCAASEAVRRGSPRPRVHCAPPSSECDAGQGGGRVSAQRSGAAHGLTAHALVVWQRKSVAFLSLVASVSAFQAGSFFAPTGRSLQLRSAQSAVSAPRAAGRKPTALQVLSSCVRVSDGGAVPARAAAQRSAGAARTRCGCMCAHYAGFRLLARVKIRCEICIDARTLSCALAAHSAFPLSSSLSRLPLQMAFDIEGLNQKMKDQRLKHLEEQAMEALKTAV